MNVFVLCTGRCGSMTFARACSHISNFSSGHETRNHMTGPKRMSYPDNHIEADNRLAFYLGPLEKRHGDNAYNVHLHRDRDSVIKSYANRKLSLLMKVFQLGILLPPGNSNFVEVATEFHDLTTTNIEVFLSDKSNVFSFALKRAETDFPEFWKMIGATIIRGREPFRLQKVVATTSRKFRIRLELCFSQLEGIGTQNESRFVPIGLCPLGR